MNNKVFVELYVPLIEKKYSVFLPINKRVFEIVSLLEKAVSDLTMEYDYDKMDEKLYNRLTGREYDMNLVLKDTDIRNGTQLLLV